MSMQNTPPIEQPHQIKESAITPWWKVLLFIAMLIASSVSIFKFSIWLGAILYMAAIVFHTYGGFGVAQQIVGETRFRVVGFLVTWSLVIIFSALSQIIFPAFVDLFISFGASLPGLTDFVLKAYPALLLLPIIIGYVWAFWPVKSARLKAATLFGLIRIGLMVIALGSMYLPILEMGRVV